MRHLPVSFNEFWWYEKTDRKERENIRSKNIFL